MSREQNSKAQPFQLRHPGTNSRSTSMAHGRESPEHRGYGYSGGVHARRSFDYVESDAVHTPRRGIFELPFTPMPSSTSPSSHFHNNSMNTIQKSEVAPKVRTFWLSNEAAAVKKFGSTCELTTLGATQKTASPTSKIDVYVHSKTFEQCLIALGFDRDGEVDGVAGTYIPSMRAPPGLSGHLAMIRSLSLLNCNLTPQHILQLPVLPNVMAADFSDNPLVGIGESECIEDAYWLAFAPKLEQLTMRGCGLQKIPPLVAAPHIKELDLACNEITSLAGVDFQLGQLQKLDVSFNSIQTIMEFRGLSLVPALKVLIAHPNPCSLVDGPNATRIQLRNFLPGLTRLDEFDVAAPLGTKVTCTSKVRPQKRIPVVLAVEKDYVASPMVRTLPLPPPIEDESLRLHSTFTNDARTPRAQREKMIELATPRKIEGPFIKELFLPAPDMESRPALSKSAAASFPKPKPSTRQSEMFENVSVAPTLSTLHDSRSTFRSTKRTEGMFSSMLPPPSIPDAIMRTKSAASVTNSVKDDANQWKGPSACPDISPEEALSELNLKTLTALSAVKKLLEVVSARADPLPVLLALENVGLLVPAVSLDTALSIMRSPSEKDIISCLPIVSAPAIILEKIRISAIQFVAAMHAVTAVATWASNAQDIDLDTHVAELFVSSLLVSPVGHLCASFLER